MAKSPPTLFLVYIHMHTLLFLQIHPRMRWRLIVKRLCFAKLFENRLSATGLLAQAWIGDLVDAKIDEGERGTQYSDAEARRQEPPPRTKQKSGVIRGREQHIAPGRAGDIAQSQILQGRLGQDHIDYCAKELRRHNRRLVGQDLVANDPPC